MRRARHPTRTSCGFTLVELVIVISIMAIVAAVAAPRYSSALVRYRLDAAAKRVASDIEYVGSYAKARSAPQAVVFNVVGSGYSSTGLVSPDRRQANYGVNLTKEPYRVAMISADFGGSATATFDGFGTPAAAGQVVIGAGNQGRRISLDVVSGKTSIAVVSLP